METSVAALTVRLADPLAEPEAAVMIVIPALAADAKP